MKLSIIICFTIATAGLILNIKHTNPYFDPKKVSSYCDWIQKSLPNIQ